VKFRDNEEILLLSEVKSPLFMLQNPGHNPDKIKLVNLMKDNLDRMQHIYSNNGAAPVLGVLVQGK
jgi:hypothetical protein